jgi:hypothetical protein
MRRKFAALMFAGALAVLVVPLADARPGYTPLIAGTGGSAPGDSSFTEEGTMLLVGSALIALGAAMRRTESQ